MIAYFSHGVVGGTAQSSRSPPSTVQCSARPSIDYPVCDAVLTVAKFVHRDVLAVRATSRARLGALGGLRASGGWPLSPHEVRGLRHLQTAHPERALFLRDPPGGFEAVSPGLLW